MNDLSIELKTDTGKCMYQQIYEYIRNEIRTGKLQRNEKLPSTRSLAEYLQVARNTVDSAYGQLLAEGYIIARPCKGYFVCGTDDLLNLSWTEEGYRETKPGGSGKKEERDNRVMDHGIKCPEIKYDFSPHAISMKSFPFSTWKRITREILVDANTEMFALGDPRGDQELRTTISRYLHSARGVNCEPDQVIIGAGNDFLLMLLEKILGRHVPIAMENPTYRRAYQVFRSFAYEIKTIPMDQSGIRVKELERSGARVAYVMPSHQYPTGIVMPIGRRLELLKWAEKEEDRFLIEDDYDSEFRYKGKPIPSLQASDRSGKVIYIGTFSKSIAPAIRVGYMVLPVTLLEKYKENCGFYASTVSRIDQRILNEFIKDGYFERYLNKMRKTYREKHDFLMDQLKDFTKEFSVSGENAGLHVLLTSKRKVPEKALLEAAAKEGIRLYGLSDALVGAPETAEEDGHTILLGYGALSREEIREGMERLKEAWREFL
ncbi:MAG: PLP-dependent aminotransferase family protein [Lachnospiraceae bacterium]|nr:PLP-dependent aminotransferase family protein [Lachnospiraceae bacterium]